MIKILQILAVNLPLVLSTSGVSLACTEVQITDSEKQKSLTGKTAEEALQSLNRDVANANQKLEKQDLQAIQESQEATQIMAEMGAKAVGDLAKMMNWEDGSPQKIALHGLIGYLSAKVGGGNTAASTLSAMGSEYINTEIANYLQHSIPNSYKVVFGIEASINATAESIPYFTGKKESSLDNLGGSVSKVLVDSTHAAIFSKSNAVIGFSADFIKNLSEGNSVKDAAISSAVSSVAGKGAATVTQNESLQRVISSGSSKVYEYQKENLKGKNNEN
ncbi:hypothetical protein Q7458_09800 [Glaesserella parasuis]|nr:hypothetical protein [Glaesserella parasuis]MDO9851698.1 hypothetical protein [Glaesserella parasuis]MDO9865336.1 hypothetical protein [Glaesserella parasuis]MDO9882907.1 hypothetical protein [Glaesserella parasuis]MDO9885413.1 hypothetical protein [Glaesserella parasuis]